MTWVGYSRLSLFVSETHPSLTQRAKCNKICTLNSKLTEMACYLDPFSCYHFHMRLQQSNFNGIWVMNMMSYRRPIVGVFVKVAYCTPLSP